MAQQKKRLFVELRDIILRNVLGGQKTLNQIASETGISWKTVDNHITFLIGKGLVKEIFSSRYVRIVEITEKGLEITRKSQKNPQKNPKLKPGKFEQRGEVNIA